MTKISENLDFSEVTKIPLKLQIERMKALKVQSHTLLLFEVFESSVY